MWKSYFKFIKLVPGKVVVKHHGTIDFSKDNLPVDLIKDLFDDNFPYLEMTAEGKRKFYPDKIDSSTEKPKKKRKTNTVAENACKHNSSLS